MAQTAPRYRPFPCLSDRLSQNEPQDSANKRTLFIERAAIRPARTKLMARRSLNGAPCHDAFSGRRVREQRGRRHHHPTGDVDNGPGTARQAPTPPLALCLPGFQGVGIGGTGIIQIPHSTGGRAQTATAWRGQTLKGSDTLSKGHVSIGIRPPCTALPVTDISHDM